MNINLYSRLHHQKTPNSNNEADTTIQNAIKENLWTMRASIDKEVTIEVSTYLHL